MLSGICQFHAKPAPLIEAALAQPGGCWVYGVVGFIGRGP